MQRQTKEQGANTKSVSFQLDVNRQVKNKAKRSQFYHLHTNFQTEQVTLDALAGVIRAGYAYTAPFDKVPDERHKTCHYKANVCQVPLLWLDVETEDERSTPDYWLNQPFVRDYGAIVHTTFSHTPDKPRCRVLFVLDEALTVDEAELALVALFDAYNFVDMSVHDASRTLYGAEGCELIQPGHVLPVTILWEQFVVPYELKLDEERERQRIERQKAVQRTPVVKSDTQVSKYVQSTVKRLLEEVRNAPEGKRYVSVRDAAVRLHSLRIATWQNDEGREVLAGFEDELLKSALASGVDEGEAKLAQAIANGVHRAKPADEPGWQGYTNKPVVEPYSTPNEPPPPPNWNEPPPDKPPPKKEPDEQPAEDVLAADFFAKANDTTKPPVRHTCKSARKKGAAINIYMEYTTFRPFTDHDWRNCPGCLDDYAYRKTRQVEREAKRQTMKLEWFEDKEEYTRWRKNCHNKKRRGKGQVAYTPFHQEDGRVAVIDSSGEGEELPAGEELDALIMELCQTPGDKRNRASAGFGCEWQGTRGEGRAKEEKRKTGKRPASYNLKTNASTARVVKYAYQTELDARGRGQKDIHCTDSFLALKDWQTDELVQGSDFLLDERFEHGSDNEVVSAIFEDELVQEAIKYYQAYKEANAEVTPLLSTEEQELYVDVKDVNQEVTVSQQTLEYTSNSTLEVDEQLRPATGTPPIFLAEPGGLKVVW